MTTRVDINLENELIVRKIRETIINDIVTLIVNDKTFWNKNNKALVYNLSGPETELHLPEELQTNITNVIQHFNNNTLNKNQLDNIMKFDNVRSEVHTISYAHKIDIMSYFEVKLIEENNTIDDIDLVKFLDIFRLLQPLLIKSNVFSEYYFNPQTPRGTPQTPRGTPQTPRGPPQTPRGPPQTPRGSPQTPRGSPIKDLYSILNLNNDASIKDIKKAYKTLAMIHHPDRGGDEEKFKEINIAHETLTDPTKKNNYDRTGGSKKKTSKKKAYKKKTDKKKTDKKKTYKK